MEDAYIAGLFDGEGSVGIYRASNGRSTESGSKIYWGCRLAIAGSHRPMIEELHKHIPGSTMIEDKRKVDKVAPNGKRYALGQARPVFKVQLAHKKLILEFLERIRPYLWEKAEQVAIAMAYCRGALNGEKASEQCKAAKKFSFDVTDLPERESAPCNKGEDNPMSKLSESDVRQIKLRLKNGKRGIKAQLAREYRVSKTTILKIDQGKNWSHIVI